MILGLVCHILMTVPPRGSHVLTGGQMKEHRRSLLHRYPPPHLHSLECWKVLLLLVSFVAILNCSGPVVLQSFHFLDGD